MPRETRLSYVGTRPYIRGADLLVWFNRMAGDATQGQSIASIRQFRILREIRCDGAWQAGIHQEAAAKLDYLTVYGEMQNASFVEGAHLIERRDPDIPSQILAIAPDTPFGGRATLRSDGGFADILNGLIEVNKRLHVTTLQQRGINHSGIRFAYALDLPVTCPEAEIVVKVSLMSERELDGKRYTLCQLSSPAFAKPVKLCYLY